MAVVLPPNTAIVSAPVHDTQEADATFTFTGSSTSATFECSLNDSAWAGCSSPQGYQDLLPGLYVFKVRSIIDGIVDPSPAIHAWRVRPAAETDAPDTEFTGTPPVTTTNTTATFRFAASELGAEYTCSLDGAPFTACNSGITLTNLAVQEHMFEVLATDAAGNVELEPARYTWLVRRATACRRS